MRRLRTVGGLLGVTAVVLAALAAAFQIGGLAAWVPVVTTIATSVTAYIAAARYDHLVIEYLRTAQRLQHLRQDYLDQPASDPAAFIDACEAATRSKTRPGWPAGTHPPTAPTWPDRTPKARRSWPAPRWLWIRPVQALPVPARRRRFWVRTVIIGLFMLLKPWRS